MAEFSPEELDQLEDALDGLEQQDDLSALGLADPLQDRLRAYQALLRVSREALPMEEVAEGVLEGVLAEARDTRAAEPDRPGIWDRWRLALIPVFALAGTTAAVLWIVRPDQDAPSFDRPVEMAKAERTSAAEPPPGSGAAAPTVADSTETEEGAPGLALEEAKAPAADDASEVASQAASAAPPGAQKSAPKQAYDREDPKAPEQKQLTDKEEIWDRIQEAHRLRRMGNCEGAEPLYRQAEASAANAKARAAAWMGLGLCEEEQGGIESSKYLQDAEAADPSLAATIRSERSASRSQTKSGKPSPQKKSKAADRTQQKNAFPGD